MKVTFRILPRMMEKAKSEVAEFNKDQLTKELPSGQATPMKMLADGQNLLIVYEGDRNTFLQHGGIAFVNKFYGSAERASLSVQDYEHETAVLRWNETMLDYIKVRCPLEKAIKWCKDNSLDPVMVLVGRLPEDAVRMLGKPSRLVGASLTPAEMAVWRMLTPATATA